MIADDTPANRDFLTTLLTYKGHRVLEAGDGEEALRSVIDERPDLVISDILMPKMDGYEFVRQMRSHPEVSSTQVILYSAKYHPWESDALDKIAGVQHHLVKPAEPEEILRAVNELLLSPPVRIPPSSVEEFDREHLRLLTDKLARKVEEMEVLYTKAKDAIQARDQFLSIASHELKTPLSSLKMQTQLSRRKFDKGGTALFGPEQSKKLLEYTESQIGRIERLVEDMLDVSRINSSQFPIHKSTFDLSELATGVVERFSFQLRAARCEMTFEAEPGVIGEWDRDRLEQVWNNLLSNAIKYGAGKPIRASVARHGEHAEFLVQDEGMGIPEEEQDRIFHRFERAVPAENISGLGLGLYIARQIVEAHAGTLKVASKPGCGSTFIVDLPLRTAKTIERAQPDGV